MVTISAFIVFYTASPNMDSLRKTDVSMLVKSHGPTEQYDAYHECIMYLLQRYMSCCCWERNTVFANTVFKKMSQVLWPRFLCQNGVRSVSTICVNGYSPRARSLLFMFLRSKGLNILSYVEFCVDFRTELLTNQLLCVRSEIHVMWTKFGQKW